MNCPVCTTTQLVMADRSGIEIDYCPQCRGVWLDRGELDKIIERGNQVESQPAPRRQAAAPAPAPSFPPQQVPHGDVYYDHSDGVYKTRRRKSWLHEIFD